MATPRTRTRKRARSDESETDLPLNIDSLAAFMEIEQPDRARLGQALDLARAAAAATIGRSMRDAEPHGIRHGIHMLASELLIKDQLEAAPVGAEIPGVVRYLWKASA